MSTTIESGCETAAPLTLEDLAARFGPMLLSRLRMEPAPGTANEDDLARILESEDRLFELVDGTLVEKPMGFEESQLTSWLIWVLMNHIGPRNLGLITSPDGPYRLQPGLVRLPDIAFVDKRRFPGGKLPRGGIANVVPNLAVEVLSAGNTQVEMGSKLQEYFRAGVEVVWFIDHRKRTCEVFTSPHDRTVLNQDQTLTGGAVLPGFELSLRELFSRLDDH